MNINDLKCCGNRKHSEAINQKTKKENCEVLLGVETSSICCSYWKYDGLAVEERMVDCE